MVAGPRLQRLWALEGAQFAELVERTPRSLVHELYRARLEHPSHLDEFARYAFPSQFDLPFNDLHRALFRLHDVLPWRERTEDSRVAVAAPRGFAKSTIVSFLRIAHDIVYDRETFIVLLSSTQPQARRFSRRLRTQFLAKNSRFAKLYGPFKVTGGVDEWEVSVRGRAPVAILAKSFGSEVRGAIHSSGARPSKVVVDDGEKKDRVRNPEQRQIWEETLDKDILKLGRRQGGLIVEVAGTVLHPDSMLARRLKDPGWQSQKWQAILSWPTRMDLWERCKSIWVDLTLGKHRRAAALAFYRQHKAEMDEGAQVLDPAAKSLFALFEVIWTEGLASFLSEFQNEPRDPSAQIFNSQGFKRFRELGDGTLEVQDATKRRVRIEDLRLFGRWDPAMGGLLGDFAAIAIAGRDSHGYCYLLDCWMRRDPPSVQLKTVWSLAARRGLRRMIAEGGGFQELVATNYQRERAERRATGQYWQLQIETEPSSDNKDERIATLEPDLTNGWLMVSESIPQEVLQQFDDFPSGSHDDGPDVIHAVWKGSGGRPVEMERRKAA